MGKYGQFEDMYRNEVSIAPSSNVKGGMWLRIEGDNGQCAAHLSINDAKVLIAILNKAIEEQLEDD